VPLIASCPAGPPHRLARTFELCTSSASRIRPLHKICQFCHINQPVNPLKDALTGKAAKQNGIQCMMCQCLSKLRGAELLINRISATWIWFQHDNSQASDPPQTVNVSLDCCHCNVNWNACDYKWGYLYQWRTQEFCSRGGGRFNKFRWGQIERGSGGGSPIVRGSGGSCNLVQEISFHIVKFS